MTAPHRIRQEKSGLQSSPESRLDSPVAIPQQARSRNPSGADDSALWLLSSRGLRIYPRHLALLVSLRELQEIGYDVIQ